MPHGGFSQEAPAPAPDVDAVLQELAKIGPEALVAHVDTLRKQIDDLKNEAAAARTKADELDAQSASAKARVAAVEAFMASVQAAMQPPAPEAPAAEGDARRGRAGRSCACA
jgi:uncharacterized coiled-coil DUF342 family protein